MNNKRNLLIHVLCWGFVACMPLLFGHSDDRWPRTLHHFLRSLGGTLTCALLFYINYLWLIPRLLFKERRRAFYLSNVLLVLAGMGLIYGWWLLNNHVMPAIDPSAGPRPPRLPMFFYNIIMLALVVGLAIAVRMSQRWQHLEEARREAERSRTEAELTNLRNQLNPHFLLNTLNNIYALIAFDTDKAQHAVEELSRLLRHVLYDNQQSFVPLYKEVEFMNNYVELMRIRVTDHVHIDTHIDIAPDDATPIAPLIFISLVENAFKHGIAPNGSGRIAIEMSQHDGDITCCITNSNHPKRSNDKSGSGIGLEQVGKRLELMYPGRYTWERGTTDDKTMYFSKIVIYSHEH
ncbi:MAG: histidine kinase [Muribaculaceae bacterium]|nr:histidine kinase [Muribaculaceae bacterium]